jgi:competence protein ComGF
MRRLLKLPRESGYTFLESLLQLMIMLVFVQLFVLFFLWKEPIERHYFDISGSEWQLFAVDFQLALSNVYKIEVHADGRGIRLWNKRGMIDIEQGTAVVRKRVDGSGHVPLLTNIREVKFALNQKTVFVDITLLDGKRKGREFIVGLYPK